MKKLLLINLFVVALICVAFAFSRNTETPCNMQCSSPIKDMKPKEVIGGGQTDDPVFHFNRIYIKI